jgi:hypothetical protein
MCCSIERDQNLSNQIGKLDAKEQANHKAAKAARLQAARFHYGQAIRPSSYQNY